MWWCKARLRLILVLPALLIGACGFHLRGDVAYPPEMAVTYIEAKDRYTPFYQQLRATLREGGLQLTQDPTRAGAVVRVLDDSSGERVLSVSARNTPNEFDVYYVVRYSLDIGGKEVLAPQALALNREYAYDETLVLGKAAEADEIRNALARDLVALVTRRISSVR
jgi:LPS-assembly lipoprotein